MSNYLNVPEINYDLSGLPFHYYIAHIYSPEYREARKYWWDQFHPIEDEL